MKELTYRLIDINSDKVLIITLKDKKLISETGKKEKLKTTEKEFSDADEALKNFHKKEWDALKKGFVLKNQQAEIGQPILHKFIGGGYTGSLSFQQTPIGIYIYKNAGQAERLIDQLVLIDNSGTLLKEIDLPQPLAWSIEYRYDTNSLILDIDHFIYEFNIENGTFKNLGNKERDHTSFISVTNDRTAFATSGQISIIDNRNKVLSTRDYDIEIIKGSTPFCGKLSNDGKLLAFHNKVGEIQIIDTTDGKLQNKIVGDFEMVSQIEFTNNNDLLVLREQYGTWGMRYFDLSAGKEIKLESLEIPEYAKNVDAFCFNEDQSKLVLIQRERAKVFDFNARKLLHSFKIEHVVKSCNIKFVGERLGVRTDYGCFSIYNV
jgi:hypothetical protein